MYRIINYHNGKTVVLSGGTKLDGLKTEKEAKDFLWELKKKEGKEKPMINSNMLVEKY